MQTVLKWIGMALGLVIVGLVVLVLVFDWNWIKGFVEREASKALGRIVVIEGNLDVQLSWSPLVRMDHIRIANAPWSPEPSMLTIQRLVFRLDLRELVRGRVVLPTVELVEPVVRLETSEQGQPNWALGQARPAEPSTTPLALPNIGEVRLREGHVTYTDYSSHTEIAATLTEVYAMTMAPEQRLNIEGVGQLATTPLQFTVSSGTLQDLSANRPSPVQVQLITPPWQVDLNGSQEGDLWAVRGLAGTLGTSDLRGDIFLEMQEKRPLVRAELFSHHLDVRDLQA